MRALKFADTMLFLSTLSLRRATLGQFQWVLLVGDFYPRSPCGERHGANANLRRHRNFYPRSPCGERHDQATSNQPEQRISIHALLAESDVRELQ